MSKRTILLCASVGTLVFSAGSVSPNSDSEPGIDAPRHASVAEASPAGAGGGEATSLQQLSAAYAPSAPQASGADSQSEADSPREESSALLPAPADLEEPTLWLARAIYSETKLPHEQELVAWVVRNRVETAYRGRRTYRAVVLDPYQFSAFQPRRREAGPLPAAPAGGPAPAVAAGPLGGPLRAARRGAGLPSVSGRDAAFLQRAVDAGAGGALLGGAGGLCGAGPRPVRGRRAALPVL